LVTPGRMEWETGYFARRVFLHGVYSGSECRSLSYSVADVQGLGKHISGMKSQSRPTESSSKKQDSSLVIDTLCKEVTGDNVAIAYVYCDFQVRGEQSARSVLGSVLRQVVGALALVPNEVRGAFEQARRQVDASEPRLPEILYMLVLSLSHLRKGFICIDGLDEFQTQQRTQLWDSLQRVVRECPNTRLFLTRRSHIGEDVERRFPKEADMVMIEPPLDDIGRYIEKRLKEDQHVDAMDKGLRADILRVIPENASGMYVLSWDV